MVDEMMVANVTMGMTSLGSTGLDSWFPLIIIMVLAPVCLMFIVVAISSLEHYKKLKGFIGWIVGTITYFGYGIVTSIAVAIPTGIFYFFAKQASEGHTAPFKLTLYILGGYLAICGLGWLGKQFYDRIEFLEKKTRRVK